MRLSLPTAVAAAALAAAGSALAQSAPDGPLSTAGSKADGAPTQADPAQIAETPPAPRIQPRASSDDLEAAAEQGRRAPLLGEYHGQVGAVVGSNGLRGAYGHISARPSDKVSLDLRFSTLHARGYPYDGMYGYGPGPYGDPLLAAPRRPGADGWTTETLGPDDAPVPSATPPGH